MTLKQGLVLAIALLLLSLGAGWQLPVAAAPGDGAALFAANCAACHVGGRNIIVSTKTLRQADLERYGLDSVAAIAQQIQQGKKAMPAFQGRLTPAEMTAVAEYVLAQAARHWPPIAPAGQRRVLP